MNPEHLKKLTAILLFSAQTLVVASEYDMTNINEKVAPLAAKQATIPKHLRMVDDTTDLYVTPEFQALRAKCTTDWEQIVANIEKFQGGDETRIIIIHAFENITPQSYIIAIENLVTKYENGSASEELIDAILYPIGRMRGFAKDNFNHPRIIAAINRIKAISNNVTFKSQLDRILTGAAKASLDNFREAHQGMPEGDIPVILLTN